MPYDLRCPNCNAVVALAQTDGRGNHQCDKCHLNFTVNTPPRKIVEELRRDPLLERGAF